MSNHRRMSTGTFNDFSIRCTSKVQMLALTAFPATINSLPLLFLSRAAANGSRRCKSVISADQWEADSHVLFEWINCF